MVQRARNIVKKHSDHEHTKSYKRIPSLCLDILKLNPGSQIYLQADSEGRFFRLFLMLKSSVQAIKNGCLPCIEVDGAFMKHPSYNGTCLLPLGKTGDLNIVPWAIAMVTSKRVDHFRGSL